MISDAVVTDNEWHHVGFSWDGSSRVLYADDIEVARDTQSKLTHSLGSLYIGSASNLNENAFWSGLIDDVRIYNTALSPKEISDRVQ